MQISPRSGALKQGVYHTNRYNVSDAHVSIQGALALDADEPAADAGADDGADPLLPLATNSVVIAGWESQARPPAARATTSRHVERVLTPRTLGLQIESGA